MGRIVDENYEPVYNDALVEEENIMPIQNKEYKEFVTDEELTELYLFLSDAIIPWVKKQDITMYQLCRILSFYHKLEGMLKK